MVQCNVMIRFDDGLLKYCRNESDISMSTSMHQKCNSFISKLHVYMLLLFFTHNSAKNVLIECDRYMKFSLILCLFCHIKMQEARANIKGSIAIYIVINERREHVLQEHVHCSRTCWCFSFLNIVCSLG